MTINQERDKDRQSDTVTRKKETGALSPFPPTVIPDEALSAGWSSNQPSQRDNYIS